MHTKFERLLSKSLTTLEVMTYCLVVHTGPGQQVNIIAGLHASCSLGPNKCNWPIQICLKQTRSSPFFLFLLLLSHHISGVHHFWWDFCVCDCFSVNQRGSHIPFSWMVHAGCVFVAGIQLSKTWMPGSFEAMWWNAYMCAQTGPRFVLSSERV